MILALLLLSAFKILICSLVIIISPLLILGIIFWDDEKFFKILDKYYDYINQ